MPGGSPIVQERVLRASPEDVFDAWRDPKRLAIWMCPSDGMRPATVQLDFRVGGKFEIAMHGENEDFVQSGEFFEIEAPKRIVFSWVSNWMPEDEQATRVTVSVEPDSAGCRLRLVHDRLPKTDSYDGHEGGWKRILDLAQQNLETSA